MELRGACDGRLSAIDGAMDERKRRALVCSSLEMQSTDTDARPACAESTPVTCPPPHSASTYRARPGNASSGCAQSRPLLSPLCLSPGVKITCSDEEAPGAAGQGSNAAGSGGGRASRAGSASLREPVEASFHDDALGRLQRVHADTIDFCSSLRCLALISNPAPAWR